MTNPKDVLLHVVRALDSGRLHEALDAAASLVPEPSDAWAPASRATRALAHCWTGDWDAALAALEGLEPRAEDGPLIPGMGAVALACREPSEEALGLALRSLFSPRRPIPLLAAPGMSALTRFFEQHGAQRLRAVALDPAVASRALEANDHDTAREGAPPPAAEAPSVDPLLRLVLDLVSPDPAQGRDGLREALQAGLDLPALHLALARLHRLAGDPAAARQILTSIDSENLGRPLAPWRSREQSFLDTLPARSRDEAPEQILAHRKGETLRLRLEDGRFLVLEQRSPLPPPHDDSPPGAQAVRRRWIALPRSPATELLARASDLADADFSLDVTERATHQMDSLPSLPETASRDELGAALRHGRHLLLEHPGHAPLARHLEDVSQRLRGPIATIPLTERSLALFGETAEALTRLAGLLLDSGWVTEALGVLFHLERTHGLSGLSAAGWATLVDAHVVPRLATGIAHALLEPACRRHPDAPELAEVRARLAYWQGDHGLALDALLPLMAKSAVPLRRVVLALQIHLEGEIPGATTLLRAARSRYAHHPLLEAARLEIEGHASAALNAYHDAVIGAPSPLAGLEAELYAMRAACRLSQFEEGLRIARGLQTRIGPPDPRCLAAIHECLTALEPSEVRDDLAEIAREARLRSDEAVLTSAARRDATLAAGLYLDPDLLEPLWRQVSSAPEADAPLAEGTQEVADALICCATGTAAAALFDPQELAAHAPPTAAGWLADAEALAALSSQSAVALAPAPQPTGPMWIRLTSRPLLKAEQPLYTEAYHGALLVPSGQLYVGPAEPLACLADDDPDPMALAIELGGRTRRLSPGRYGVRIFRRTSDPWPEDLLAADPCDVIVRLEALSA